MSKVTIVYKTEVTLDIDLKKVLDYLVSHGWVEDDQLFGRFGRIFKKENEQVLMVTTDQIGDWNARMNELVHDYYRLTPEQGSTLLDMLFPELPFSSHR